MPRDTSESRLAGMRRSGRVIAEIRDALAVAVAPGKTTREVGELARQLIEERGHVTDLLTDEAVKWIESRGSAPFFLYLPYTAIHLPLKEPTQWVERVPESM